MKCTCDDIGEGACPEHGEAMRLQDVLGCGPRISRSDLLTVVVEPDAEESDDEKAWTLVLACEGPDIPKYFGGGYLHLSKCACNATVKKLCDVGWLQEFVACVGVFPLIDGNIALHFNNSTKFNRLKLTGHMVSERFDGIEGADYDEYFEVKSVTSL